jgi:hypothetical protein
MSQTHRTAPIRNHESIPALHIVRGLGDGKVDDAPGSLPSARHNSIQKVPPKSPLRREFRLGEPITRPPPNIKIPIAVLPIINTLMKPEDSRTNKDVDELIQWMDRFCHASIFNKMKGKAILYKKATLEIYTQGKAVFYQGDKANKLYVLLDGQVEIKRRHADREYHLPVDADVGDQIVSLSNAGVHIGEAGLLEEQLRNSSVVVDEGRYAIFMGKSKFRFHLLHF